tara:strand:+ start:54 stop:461 length:408 start_codon:yes stop_codon:yes gene_type:complete
METVFPAYWRLIKQNFPKVAQLIEDLFRNGEVTVHDGICNWQLILHCIDFLNQEDDLPIQIAVKKLGRARIPNALFKVNWDDTVVCYHKNVKQPAMMPVKFPENIFGGFFIADAKSPKIYVLKVKKNPMRATSYV